MFSSCDFADRSFVPKTKDDPRSDTNPHEPKQSCLELDPTFEEPVQKRSSSCSWRRTARTPLCFVALMEILTLRLSVFISKMIQPPGTTLKGGLTA